MKTILKTCSVEIIVDNFKTNLSMPSETVSTGDMLKSVYDSNNNGIVDNAEKVNDHTVESDVPTDAKFTDTVYDDSELAQVVNGLSENKEDKVNKITAWQITPDDTHYPSEKLVKEEIDNINTEIGDIDTALNSILGREV